MLNVAILHIAQIYAHVFIVHGIEQSTLYTAYGEIDDLRVQDHLNQRHISFYETESTGVFIMLGKIHQMQAGDSYYGSLFHTVTFLYFKFENFMLSSTIRGFIS